MITSERDWKHRMTVYSVRCDGCSHERAVHVYDRVDGDDGPIREEDLRKQGGVSWVDGKWDLCAACDACAAGSISSSWDVRDGEVREKPVMTFAGYPVWADDLGTPAKANAQASGLAKRISETNDTLKHASERLQEAAEQWRAYERDRLRAAMAGMANVMACVVHAIDGREACLLMVSAQGRGDMELPALVQIGKVVVTRAHVKAVASAEWSRRVREGVAKLPPPGPRVYCASEED